MIRTLEQETKVKWTKHLNALCSAYNSTIHSFTGFSLFWLMMGRKPRLAVDLNMGTSLLEHGPSSSSKYIQDLERKPQWSHELAQKHMEKQANKAKKYYDRKVRCSKLEPGDLVLVKRFGFKGKHKIQDRWENQIYEVLEFCHSSPLVFRIRKEDGTGKIRILHRNLLLPLRTRILDEESPPPTKELDDSSQAGNPVESIQESQEDSLEDEQDSQSVSKNGDDQSMSTRPWTRSQGPPPALLGTQSLSRCSLQSPPTLLQRQEGVPDEIPRGYTGRLVAWTSSFFEELHQLVY